MKHIIEQDGTLFRWVLMLGDRRLAKGYLWWDTMDAAEDDFDEFCKAASVAGTLTLNKGEKP